MSFLPSTKLHSSAYCSGRLSFPPPIEKSETFGVSSCLLKKKDNERQIKLLKKYRVMHLFVLYNTYVLLPLTKLW